MGPVETNGRPALVEVRPGELHVGPERVALLPLAGCVSGVLEVMSDKLGPEVAARVLYEGGRYVSGVLVALACGETAEERVRSGLVEGFRVSGFGLLRILSFDWEEPRVEVSVERGFGLVKMGRGGNGQPQCSVQRGMIAAFLEEMLRREGREDVEVYVAERECAAQTGHACRFVAAPARTLEAEGVDVSREVPPLSQRLLEALRRARESEALYRTLVNSVDGFIWLVDENMRFAFHNDRWYEHTGYSREEMEGKPFTDIVHPEDLGRTFEAAERLRAGETVRDLEYRIRTRGGRWRIHRATVVPLSSSPGEPPRMGLGISHDITEDKARQERMDYLDSLYKGIIDNANVLILSVDREGLVTVFNKAMERLTGYSREAFLGRPLRELLPPDTVAAVEATINNHLSGFALEEWDLRVLAKDGSLRVLRMQPSPVVVGEEVIGVVEVGRDVTGEVDREYAEAYRAEMEKELEDLRRQIEGKYRFSNIVARAPRMRRVFEVIRAVSASSATVLIQGETGTGKALVARAIHYNSPRRDKPFVEVDCGVLSETLLESELFGHVRGAFTGALRDKIGRFELANGGTIFLDEIANLSFPLQAKLLRAVQEGKFERVGGTDTVTVDVRIIAATNEDLAALVESGRFRKDLYYRLNVIKIDLPPLRERREDVPLLAMHFLERFARKNGKELKGMTGGALDKLLSYHWPGNVRELENVIEQAVVFAQGQWVEPEDVRLPESGPPEYVPAAMKGGVLPLSKVLEVPERAYIAEVLKLVKGNKSRAARLLGISRSTLYQKMVRYGLVE